MAGSASQAATEDGCDGAEPLLMTSVEVDGQPPAGTSTPFERQDWSLDAEVSISQLCLFPGAALTSVAYDSASSALGRGPLLCQRLQP